MDAEESRDGFCEMRDRWPLESMEQSAVGRQHTRSGVEPPTSGTRAARALPRLNSPQVAAFRSSSSADMRSSTTGERRGEAVIGGALQLTCSGRRCSRLPIGALPPRTYSGQTVEPTSDTGRLFVTIVSCQNALVAGVGSTFS